MKKLIVLMTALFAVPGYADSYLSPPDLPPLATVSMALNNTPTVRAATANLGVEAANRDRLRAGGYETSLRLNSQQRHTLVPDNRYHEWDVSLERPLRLPNKSRIDNELGDQGVEQAHYMLGDALHESGRMLLASWFGWLREYYQTRQWQTQVDGLTEQLRIVQKRVKAGDAAKLDQLQAEAALSQAQAQLAEAGLRAAIARNELSSRYPAIVIPVNPILPQPEPVTDGLEVWQQRTMEHNHELAIAHSETQRYSLLLSRSEADRIPDPSVGLHYADERGGEEKVVGVSLTIPLPGGGRKASQQMAAASQLVALEREQGVRTKIRTETANSWLATQSAYSAWQASENASAATRKQADLMTRAYQLGESGLTDVLNARRMAQEADLNAINSRLAAAQARYRLLLDTHALWPIDADEDEVAKK
ncbi:MAG: TolC family protein [Sulfuriferula sp.]|nr:TolC family protein [Sulfuriferula sp.]